MCASPSSGTDDSEEFLLEVVDTLEAHGHDAKSYQLHDYVDVDALERLLSASADGLEVRFTVEDVSLAVTGDGVRVLDH